MALPKAETPSACAVAASVTPVLAWFLARTVSASVAVIALAFVLALPRASEACTAAALAAPNADAPRARLVTFDV